MNKTIYKYPITGTGESTLMLPKGFNILTYGHRDMDYCCLWAEVDPNAEKEMVTFFVAGTGWELPYTPESREYIGTAFDGTFVWHLYRKVNN